MVFLQQFCDYFRCTCGIQCMSKTAVASYLCLHIGCFGLAEVKNSLIAALLQAWGCVVWTFHLSLLFFDCVRALYWILSHFNAAPKYRIASYTESALSAALRFLCGVCCVCSPTNSYREWAMTYYISKSVARDQEQTLAKKHTNADVLANLAHRD